MPPTVWTYLYGGLMTPATMRRLGLEPRTLRLASLQGFEIGFSPWVTLTPAPAATTYGLIAETTHDELAAAYGQLATPYLPYPVVVLDDESRLRPALCYLAHETADGRPDSDNIRGVIATLEARGAPDWYLERLRGFLPAGA